MSKFKEASPAGVRNGGPEGRAAWRPRLRKRTPAHRFRMTGAGRVSIAAALTGFAGLTAARLYAPHVVVHQELGGILSAVCAGLFTLFLVIWADLLLGPFDSIVVGWTFFALWFLVDLLLAIGNFSLRGELEPLVIACAILYWASWYWIVSATRHSRRQ